MFRLCIVLCFVLHLIDGKSNTEKVYMEKFCGTDPLVLDGDQRPGVVLYLTSSSKYKANFNCTMKVKTGQTSQRLIISVEKLGIDDCPGDRLLILDGTTQLNSDLKQQCGGSSAPFTLISTTNQISLTFLSNSAKESSGFQIALALHFPTVSTCPQNLGFFQCKNKFCISKQITCDGHNHCGDGTDEAQCSLLSG